MHEFTYRDRDDGDPNEEGSTSADDGGLTDPEEILQRIESLEADTNHAPERSDAADGDDQQQVVEPRPDRTFECLDCGGVFDSMPYKCECGSTAFRTGSTDDESHEGVATWFAGSVARMTASYNPYVPR